MGGELLQSYLVINVTGLFQFGKNLSYILSPLASKDYLLQNISVKLTYQFLYFIYSYLLFRCLEKVLEEERNKNQEGKLIILEIDRDVETLGFDPEN